MPWLKPGIFIGALVPLALDGAARTSQGTLSANPIAEIDNELGLTALIFLVASLACTPARRLFGWTWPTRIRRELGLFAFFYAVLHFLTYLVLDQAFDWRDHLRGHRQAAVHHRRVPGAGADGAAGADLDHGVGPAAGLPPLAAAAPAWLRGRRAGRHPLHLAGQDRRQPAARSTRSILAALLAVRVVVWLRQRSADPPARPAGPARPPRTDPA